MAHQERLPEDNEPEEELTVEVSPEVSEIFEEARKSREPFTEKIKELKDQRRKLKKELNFPSYTRSLQQIEEELVDVEKEIENTTNERSLIEEAAKERIKQRKGAVT